MDLLDNPLLRRTLAPQPAPDLHAEPRRRLLDALLRMRERAKMLAGEIHRDLPDFTVHDITHLDALWEMADLIAGPDYPLNPLEAFALGAVFLLHDLGLGLAAYPGGLAELKKGRGWEDALSTYLRKHLERIPTAEELASPPPEVERMAVQERLRVLHAEQAERLALAYWQHGGGPEYHLIEDPDLRRLIGRLLGKIAHSHWWPVSRLGSEFSTIRGALPICPRDWTLDPLKIAVLLRTADAAHLDARRAPSFLIALRRPEGMAEDHWLFQNHLLKPQVDDDRLIYTTARPFPAEEADAWWLCEETLRMVDRELRQVNALLADRGRPTRLRARSVAGVESTNRLPKYIEVSDWTPVDARLHVSSVADLVRRLGGEQLYGKRPYVPLRELIQNASDAVRARRLLENRPDNWGCITVRIGRDEDGPWIEVEDTGIGMSEAVLSGPLMDFGTTYWGSALMREEHEGLWAKGFEPVGKFGIGFFSVFMWGHRVRVLTRRYDDGASKTRALEFYTGLESRPLVRSLKVEEQLRDGGTIVRTWLNKEPGESGGLLYSVRNFWTREQKLDLGALCAWIAPALSVDLYAEYGNEVRCVVAASDWITLDGVDFLTRITLRPFEENERYLGSLLGFVKGPDGRILGRAALISGIILDLRRKKNPTSTPLEPLGVIVVGGLRADYISYKNRSQLIWGAAVDCAGAFVGSIGGTSRDSATPLANSDILAAWASDQAELADRFLSDYEDKLKYATSVLLWGGDPGRLPIGRMGDVYVNRDFLVSWEGIPDEILLAFSDVNLSDKTIRYHISEPPCIIRFLSAEALGILKETIAQAWCCSLDEINAVSQQVKRSFTKHAALIGVIVRRPVRKSP